MSRYPFIEIEDVLYFHQREMEYSGTSVEIRDFGALESAIAAPQATFGGEYLMDIFEMAATYANSLAMNHPFLDGNKRTAALVALAFLFMNGYELNEQYDEELADRILDLVVKKICKDDLADYFRLGCSRD